MNDWSGRLRDSRGHTNKHIRLISARILSIAICYIILKTAFRMQKVT